MSGKLPYMQFFPHDWLTAPDLRACSPAARGFWMDLLCLMWDCPRRGILKTSGHAWDVKEIATATGNDPRSCQEWLNELVKLGVTKRRKSDGAFVNRRMIREEKQRQEWRKRQEKHRDAAKACHGDVTSFSRCSSEVRSHKDLRENLQAPAVCGKVENQEARPEEKAALRQIEDAQAELRKDPKHRGARIAFDEGQAALRKLHAVVGSIAARKAL